MKSSISLKFSNTFVGVRMSWKSRIVVGCFFGFFAMLLFMFVHFSNDVPLGETEMISVTYKSKLKSPGKHEGSPILVPMSVIEYLTLNAPRTIELPRFNDENMAKFVFVTAASSNHFKESLDMIGSVQRYFPKYKILYYDLGLWSWQLESLSSLCSVHVIRFPFEKFPSHVRNLKTCAWKFIIVQEVIQVYKALLWVDASVRMKTSNLQPLFDKAKETDGLAFALQTSHTNHATMHKNLYSFFPTDIEKQKYTEQVGAGFFLMYNTREVFYDVLFWVVACSLDKACIQPINNEFCKFKDKKRIEFANCHRFDQATVNIVLSNKFRYNATNYRAPETSVVRIWHRPGKDFPPKSCRMS